jgi:predicted phage terminase large subunit-like protein
VTPVELARLSPLAWGRYALRGRIERPKHLALIEKHLLRVATGATKRLMVFAPPRHAKSVTCSQVFTSWLLGVFPNKRIAVVSHGEDLATSWARKARDMLGEHGQTVFGVRVREDVKAAGRWELAPPHEGGFFAAGVGGPLTGRGFDLIILDDVVKNAEEAYSELQRKRTLDWYQTTLRSRLQPGGAIIHLQTRWHEDDLAGRLLADAREGRGEMWETIVLRAIAEEDDLLGRKPGEALWPEFMPLEELLQAKVGSGSFAATGENAGIGGSVTWAALWQQRPSPAEGSIFKREWFANRFTWWDASGAVQIGSKPPITRESLRIIASVDVALSTKTAADYTVCAILAQEERGGPVLLLDLLRKKMEAPDLVRELRSFAIDEWGAAGIYIEKTGVGLAIVQAAREAGLPIFEVAVDKDKISRALPLAAACAAGDFLLPAANTAPWLDVALDELLGFGGGARHDDVVDALSQGWAAMASLSSGWFLGASSSPRPRAYLPADTYPTAPPQDFFRGSSPFGGGGRSFPW